MSSSQFPPPLSYSSSGQGATGTSSLHSPPGILSPDSTNSIYASPDSGHHPFYLAKSEPDDGASTGSSSVAAGPSSNEPLKKKQKRNKPTLSCHECVERKTKVSTSSLFFFSIISLPSSFNLASSSSLPHFFCLFIFAYVVLLYSGVLISLIPVFFFLSLNTDGAQPMPRLFGFEQPNAAPGFSRVLVERIASVRRATDASANSS